MSATRELALLAPDVEWVTPQRTLHGITDIREELELGLITPENFDYAFEEGEWTDDGEGRLVCEVRQVYRVRKTWSDFAYERMRRVRLTVHQREDRPLRDQHHRLTAAHHGSSPWGRR